MTNPIPRFKVTMEYEKKLKHKDWSLEFFSKEDVAEFFVANVDVFKGKKYVVEKL